MLNIERYWDEIKEEAGTFGLIKGEIRNCYREDADCYDCSFCSRYNEGMPCKERRFLWLHEGKPDPERELNIEHYWEKIEKLKDFAVNVNTNEVVRCGNNIKCKNCAFHEKCIIKKMEWLRSEYHEKTPTIPEWEFLRIVKRGTVRKDCTGNAIYACGRTGKEIHVNIFYNLKFDYIPVDYYLDIKETLRNNRVELRKCR